MSQSPWSSSPPEDESQPSHGATPPDEMPSSDASSAAYGSPPPYGSPAPYGSAAPYGSQGSPSPDEAFPSLGSPPPFASPPRLSVATVVLVVISFLGMGCILITAIPMAFGIVSLVKASTDPDASDRYARIGWWSLLACVLLAALVIGGLIALSSSTY